MLNSESEHLMELRDEYINDFEGQDDMIGIMMNEGEEEGKCDDEEMNSEEQVIDDEINAQSND